MKIIVGLGNPGAQYAGTRHNVGFDVIAELSHRWLCGKGQRKFSSEVWEARVNSETVLLVTPLTFMNRSGEAVQALVRFFQVPGKDLVVICDDMNLPLGRIRWRASGSAGGQKGLADILGRMGSEEVSRLRLGVGRPPGQMDPAVWVLSRFRSEERDLCETMTKLAADSVQAWVSDGIVSAMNRFNKAGDET